MGCIQSITCKARIRRENIVVYDVCATIDQCPTRIEETSPIVLRYKTPYFKASARVVMPPIPRHETWVVGWIQACNQMEFFNTYSDLGMVFRVLCDFFIPLGCPAEAEEQPQVLNTTPKRFPGSSWELPDLREGRVKAISDSDGVSYPWYGNTTETVTLVGPTNKISRFSVSMNDNFYPSVTWAVPVSDSNVPLLTRIKRDQSFTTWLVAMNTTTKEKIILQTIKWRMRVDIEVDPLQLLGQRARLVGRTQQEQPRILSRMEPIPPNALVKPNANDAQVLMWRPKRGPPLVVIPPK
ncbi:protein FAM78B isoform X1 [Cricetulus griseus]|uniref:Protein FAM78B isoform X1 n=3 Tax=Boreoeutheria TaxID=1437010 RepID=A0A9J7H211_CRIGR|nr:protein FAM78B isoform X1 [Cricetulus griseus]